MAAVAEAQPWPWDDVAARAGRKRWTLDRQNHVIPTQQGDYVFLAPPAPQPQVASRSPLPPVPRLLPAPRPTRPASHAAADVRAQLVDVLQARPLRAPLGHRGTGSGTTGRGAGGPPLNGQVAPLAAARTEAREASVGRLRNRVRRAESELAAALAESERVALRERAEEQAQIEAAIAASLETTTGRGSSGVEACSSSCGGANTSGIGSSGDSRVRAAAGSSASGHDMDVRGGPSRRAGKQPMHGRVPCAPMAPVREEPAVSDEAKWPCAVARPPGQSHADGATAQCAEDEVVAESEADAEEARQMAWAIAESVAAEERVRADARHDDAQVLYGIVDSLRHAAAQGPSTDAHSGHAAAGSSNDRSDSIEADPNDSQRVAGGGISQPRPMFVQEFGG